MARTTHDAERLWAAWLARTYPEFRDSARNLVHYCALRRHDLQGLQQDLTVYGMSSLGRSEPHIVSVLRGRLGPDDAPVAGALPMPGPGSAVATTANTRT